jgi:hypothetical protein
MKQGAFGWPRRSWAGPISNHADQMPGSNRRPDLDEGQPRISDDCAPDKGSALVRRQRVSIYHSYLESVGAWVGG